MKDSAKYVKIVEWSEEDQCYVGSSPGLIYGGCHGDDEKKAATVEAMEKFEKQEHKKAKKQEGGKVNKAQQVA